MQIPGSRARERLTYNTSQYHFRFLDPQLAQAMKNIFDVFLLSLPTRLSSNRSCKFCDRSIRQLSNPLGHPPPARGVPVITATSRNGDNKNGDMPKRRHSKTATTRVKTATTISQNGDKHWSKRRQPLVKTVKNFGQNGDEFWSKRRQSLVKTATVVSQDFGSKRRRI